MKGLNRINALFIVLNFGAPFLPAVTEKTLFIIRSVKEPNDSLFRITNETASQPIDKSLCYSARRKTFS